MRRVIARPELDALADEIVEIAAIPAPTFAEAARGRDVAARLAATGLEPWTDEAGNVPARIGPRGKAIVVAAPLDPVSPLETPLPPRRNGNRLLGPGIGDNAAALGVLIHVARALVAV